MISLVIPAYNEEGAVEETIATARKVFEAEGYSECEIIIVDDGSSDRTAEIATASGATVLRHLQNLGYGRSLKDGITAAKNDIIVIADADGTYPIDRVPDLIRAYNLGHDMVVAARTGEHYKESAIKAPLRRIARWLVEFTAGRQIPDINSGLRVFSRSEAMRFFPHLSDAFSFTTSITLAYMLRKKYVYYIDIPYHKRIGVTKVRLLRDSLRMLQYIVQAILYFNPIKLFLAIASITSVSAILMMVVAAVMASGPVFIASIGFIITSILLFGMGLLADLLCQIMEKP